MKTFKNSEETVNAYNNYKNEIHRIETFYSNKLSTLINISSSIIKKSFGKNIGKYDREQIFKFTDLKWLIHKDRVFPAYRFNIKSITESKVSIYLDIRLFPNNKREEIIVEIPQKFLKMSDRDFAKLIRQQIKEYRLLKEQFILQNFDETLKERNNELKTLQSEINHIHNLKKKAENKS